MADQLMSLDALAQSATGVANTSLYTPEERTRLNELVNMDVGMETASELYFVLAVTMGWPSSVEADTNVPFIPGNVEPYDYLERIAVDADSLRQHLNDEQRIVWDETHQKITNENYEETKSIQDRANLRRRDPEVQRFEKFLASGITYMTKYWNENQGRQLIPTGPKSPLALNVTMNINQTMVVDAAGKSNPKTSITTVASFRKKNILAGK